DVRGDGAEMFRQWGGAVTTVETGGQLDALRRRLEHAGVVVDGLLGTGLNAPVEGVLAAVIDAINAAGRPVFAIDIPSGLASDTGQPVGTAVRAAVADTGA